MPPRRSGALLLLSTTVLTAGCVLAPGPEPIPFPARYAALVETDDTGALSGARRVVASARHQRAAGG
jgi:hypothetical protein